MLEKTELARAIPPIISVSYAKTLVLGAVTAIVLPTMMWQTTMLRIAKWKYKKSLGLDIFEFLLQPWAASIQIYCYGRKKWTLLLNHHELGFLLLVAKYILNSQWKGERRQDNLIKWPDLDAKTLWNTAFVLDDHEPN